MKIAFNLINVGAGNNGGTCTIYNSANTLRSLGYDVIIVDSGPNKNTWVSLECDRLVINDINKFPKVDAVVATGFKSVKPTVNIKQSCLKFHWIRAWETWIYNESDIIRNVLKKPTTKLVNSLCLREKLSEYGFNSYIVRPGYDIGNYYQDRKNNSNSIIIGGLCKYGFHGKRKRTKWIFDVVSKLKRKYNIKLWMFGSEKNPNNSLIDNYLYQPSIEEKRKFYSMVDIWLAPTKSEGLHMPPAEAMLCNTPVVGTTAKLSGMSDYLIHENTGLCSGNSIESLVDDCSRLIKNNDERIKFGWDGRQKILSLGNREYNMRKFVDLLYSLKGHHDI